MSHCVYVHQNKINLKIYVGYSSRVKNRWEDQRRVAYHSQNTRYNDPFYTAIRKYGWDNFTHQIIEEFDTKIEALDAEKFWIEYFRSNRKMFGPNYGYNMTEGGENVPIMKGRKFSDEHKRKIGEANRINGLGRKASEETKRKMSEAQSGEKHPNFGKKRKPETVQKMSAARKGKKQNLTAEARLRKSEAMKGLKRTETTKRKISESKMGDKNPMSHAARKRRAEAKKKDE